jgi:hypothetical protein
MDHRLIKVPIGAGTPRRLLPQSPGPDSSAAPSAHRFSQVGGGRRGRGGGGRLGNFPNRRTPAERSSDISAGRAVRKTSSPPSAASSVASATTLAAVLSPAGSSSQRRRGQCRTRRATAPASTHRPECGYTRSRGLCRERPRPGRAAVSTSRGRENCPGHWPARRTTCRAHARPSQSLQPDSALYQNCANIALAL